MFTVNQRQFCRVKLFMFIITRFEYKIISDAKKVGTGHKY